MAEPRIDELLARFTSGARTDPVTRLREIAAFGAVFKAPPPPDPGGGAGKVQIMGQAGAFPFGNVLNVAAGNVPPGGEQATPTQQMAQSRSVIANDSALRQTSADRDLGQSCDQQQVGAGAAASSQPTAISIEQANQMVTDHIARQAGGPLFGVLATPIGGQTVQASAVDDTSRQGAGVYAGLSDLMCKIWAWEAYVAYQGYCKAWFFEDPVGEAGCLADAESAYTRWKRNCDDTHGVTPFVPNTVKLSPGVLRWLRRMGPLGKLDSDAEFLAEHPLEVAAAVLILLPFGGVVRVPAEAVAAFVAAGATILGPAGAFAEGEAGPPMPPEEFPPRVPGVLNPGDEIPDPRDPSGATKIKV